MRIQFAALFIAAVLLLPAVLAETCYVAVAFYPGSSECKNPPVATVVHTREVPVVDIDFGCNQRTCVPEMNYNTKEFSEQYQLYSRNEQDIPLPLNYVRVQYYIDDQCTIAADDNKTEYHSLSDYRNSRGFMVSCSESEARIQHYAGKECTKPTSDTYPLGTCTLSSSGKYVVASCGSSVHADCTQSDTFLSA